MGKEAVSIGANTFQFFTRNPRGSKAKAIDEADVAAFLSYSKEHGIERILAHAPYTLNPCSKDAHTREFAWMTMADDLKRIWGVGPKLEALCNRLGFFHFDQIAAWTEAELAWVDDNLEGFKGRATREKWVAQARILAAGGSADEAERVARGEG